MQRLLLGIMLLGSVLAAGCADMSRQWAELHGLTVVGAEDCRHPMHLTPCKTVEAPQ